MLSTVPPEKPEELQLRRCITCSFITGASLRLLPLTVWLLSAFSALLTTVKLSAVLSLTEELVSLAQ